jgi:hypothetical protein
MIAGASSPEKNGLDSKLTVHTYDFKMVTEQFCQYNNNNNNNNNNNVNNNSKDHYNNFGMGEHTYMLVYAE